MGNWINQWIKIKRRQIRIFSFYKHNIGSVIPKITIKDFNNNVKSKNLEYIKGVEFHKKFENCSPRQMNVIRHVVVQEWKRNPILSSNRLTNYNLVNVIELIPILVPT